MPCNHGEIRTFGSGNAEVCISGEWGYICRDDDWDRHDADVICRQLGYFPHGKSTSTNITQWVLDCTMICKAQVRRHFTRISSYIHVYIYTYIPLPA